MSTVERIISRPDTVEEAVSFGVAVLDEHMPGWADAVDVETLNLSDGGQCVLGQLFHEYADGCEILGLCEETPQRCGFTVPDYVTWAPLEVEWRRVITERQEATA